MRGFAAAHSRAAFWIAMVPAFFALLWGRSRWGSTVGWGLYALFVIWLLTAFVWINRQAFRLCVPAMEQLDEHCDPEPLLALCQRILGQNPSSLYFRVHESYALRLLGRNEEAAVSADRAEENPRLWKDPLLLLVWSTALAPEDPRQQRVEASLEKLNRRMGPEQQTILNRVQLHRQVLSQVTTADPELEQPLLENLNRTSVPRERVGANLALGAYYAVRGDQRAEQYLNYVLDHCNKLKGARRQAERLPCLLPIAPELKNTL